MIHSPTNAAVTIKNENESISAANTRVRRTAGIPENAEVHSQNDACFEIKAVFKGEISQYHADASERVSLGTISIRFMRSIVLSTCKCVDTTTLKFLLLSCDCAHAPSDVHNAQEKIFRSKKCTFREI